VSIRLAHLVHFTMSVSGILSTLPKGFSTLKQITVWIRGIKGSRMSSGEQIKPRSRLLDLAVSYFKKEGFRVNGENVVLEGHSGVIRHFDLVVQKGRLEQGVWVRDWNRTIGVNVIINLDMASEDVNLSVPIMIGEKFSDHAKSYSNRRKITLLTKQKLGSFR
jgi:hypothetical protein